MRPRDSTGDGGMRRKWQGTAQAAEGGEASSQQAAASGPGKGSGRTRGRLGDTGVTGEPHMGHGIAELRALPRPIMLENLGGQKRGVMVGGRRCKQRYTERRK